MQQATYPGKAADISNADRDETITWAEPIIADRLRDIYSDAARPEVALQLIAHHRQLWRNILLERTTGVAIARQIIGQLLSIAGLLPSFLEAVDHAIMEELLEVVLLRYQGSRNLAKRYSMLLLTVASDLGAARAAA